MKTNSSVNRTPVVADMMNNRIGEYNLDGSVVNAALITGVFPRALAISGGCIYTADGLGKIGKFNLDGSVVNASLITEVGGSGSHGPYDLAVSGNRLLVPIYDDGVVREYTTDGGLVNAALISGLSGPTAIAIEIVPQPDIAVEQPVGTALTDNDTAAIGFGAVDVGASNAAVKTFTIWNTGPVDLTLGTITRDGTNPGDFTVDRTGMHTTVKPGESTSFSVTFAPGASGARSAAIHIVNNVSGAKNPFDISLTGDGSTTVSPTFATTASVPFTSNGYTASGLTLGTITLGFSPVPGTNLTVVDNTGAGAISGTFTGLSQGATVTATYGGNTYYFTISYTGGDGNDITLTRVAGPGQTAAYSWANLAGMPGGEGNANGTGSAARFWQPSGVAVDSGGTLYVADTGNNLIRKVTPAGVVSTMAVVAGGPGGIAVDGSGNVYVAAQYNHVILKVTPAGTVSTLAGLSGSSGSADGNGSVARFNFPNSVAVDGSGNVYVSDCLNHTIRKITPAGDVSTLAGLAGSSGSADGTGSAAMFNYPSGVAVDGGGNVYVGDAGNQTIRKVTPSGEVTTLAGLAGSYGSDNGSGSAARFGNPKGVAVDGGGNVYVADSGNQTIRKVTSTGVVTTLAGGVQGSADGSGTAAQFNDPRGVAVDGGGNVYVVDDSDCSIRKVTPSGLVSTLAGLAGKRGSADGTGSAAMFNYPSGVAVDGGGNVYVADHDNQTIRKVTPSGDVTTVAGLAGSSGSANGSGSAARFNFPQGVAVDGGGNVYVADSSNQTIRKVTPSGDVTTVAGLAGSSGSADGNGSVARFNFPTSVAVDGSGNVYVSDYNNHTIRKITPAGDVSTVAGLAGSRGGTNGLGSAARFSNPYGVAVDSSGNVYVSDEYNSSIRKITPTGDVSTLAGGFYRARGVAVDAVGNVYVADYINHSIRKVTPAGLVTTIGGTAGVMGGIDGIGAAAQFALPSSIAVSSTGLLYVADMSNNRISQGTPGFYPITTLAAASSIGTSTATLNGTVNPNGLVTTAQFEYGTSPSYGSTASVTLTPNNDTAAHAVSAALTGLASNTTYYYRLTANNADGSASSTGSFTTPGLPDIVVEQSSVGFLTDGTGTVAFGTAAVAGSAAVKTFTIWNTGPVDLTLGTITRDGTNPGDFTVDTTGMHSTVKPGESTTFSVTFSPTSTGTRTAALHIASNVGGEKNPFDIALNGTGTDASPPVAVSWSITPASVDLSGGSQMVTLQVRITDASGFSSGRFDFTAPKSIMSGGFQPWVDFNAANRVSGTAQDGIYSVTLMVPRDPNAVGTWHTNGVQLTDTLNNSGFATEVPTGSPPTFEATGDLNPPVIQSWTVTPGTVEVNAAPGVFTMDIRITDTGGGFNSGSLTWQSPDWTQYQGVNFAAANRISGTALDGIYRVTVAIPQGTAAGTWMLTGISASDGPNTTSLGVWQFPPGSPATLTVTNTPPGPDIVVEQSSFGVLTDGTGTVSFGTAAVASSAAVKTFTIRNTGPVDLTLGTITRDGTNPGDFIMNITGMHTTVKPGESTSFSVTFAPGASGARSAALHIASNVTGTKNPFDINLTGTGATALAVFKDFVSTHSSLTSLAADADAIPYHDGVKNVLKYAFNMNLAGPDSRILTAGSGTAGLPVVSLTGTGAATEIRVEFLRRKSSGLIYTPTYATNLTAFTPMTGTTTVTSIDGEWERVVVRQPSNPATTPKRFARVEVTLP